MSIVSCPRCGDKVSIPPAASPAALVRCPLCCEEYFLSDALIQLPPMLKVVGAAATASGESEYALAEPVTAGIQAGVFDTSGGEAATVAPRPQLRTVSRPRPPEKSAVGEIIKVVLGGVAGLAVGLLVLWWGFGVDVGVGPKLSQVEYLRWMVPQRFWDASVQPGNQPAGLDTLEPIPRSANQSGRKPKRNTAAADATEDPFGGGYFGSTGDSADSSESAEPPKAKQEAGDPLLTLDPLEIEEKTEVKAATNLEEELKIDDPLKDLPTAPRTTEKETEEPASEASAEANPDKEKQKEPTDEPTEKPAASEPAEDEADSPGPPEPEEPTTSEKTDEPQPATAEEPTPEPPFPEEPAEQPE